MRKTNSNCRFHDQDKVLKRSYASEAEWQNWNWRSSDDLLENGATFAASGSDPQLTAEQQAGMIPAGARIKDHCTLSNGPDGLIDVTLGRTTVTNSNCKSKFMKHVLIVSLP
ncbi:pectate lyase 1-like protein [Tanacetum coccineum]